MSKPKLITGPEMSLFFLLEEMQYPHRIPSLPKRVPLVSSYMQEKEIQPLYEIWR